MSAFGSFAKPAGSLFGQNTANAPAQQQQTSIFGATQQQQQPQQQQGTSMFGGSLLGQPPQQNQQPAVGTGSSLFGGTLGQPTQQQPQGQQVAQGGLFGGFGQQTQQTNAQPQQGQQSTNSLFGAAAAQPQQPSLFSNTSNPFAQSAAGYGAGQNNQPQSMQRQATQPTFGFGASTSANSLFKQPSQQQNTTGISGQSQGAPMFVKSTKFNDLPEEMKRILESIESHIQGRIQISNELKERKLGEEAAKGQELLRSVHKDLVGAITVLQSDAHHTKDLKGKTDQTVQDTIVATRIIDGFRNPQQSGQHLKTYASFPLEFFDRITEDMRNRLRWYKSTIEQIERKLSSVAAQTQPTPHAIASTLQAQHATFVALASKTAALDTDLQKIKALYTQLWRARTGSMRDPFNELDRGTGAEFGMDSLSLSGK